MLIAEVIQSIKPRKPLTPNQLRVQNLKQQVERSKQQLAGERDRQRRQREQERLCKAQASVGKLGNA